MPDSFGARLRQRREERQIALGAIADETKIKLSLLESLEHDDVSHWPSGIFRRAYIRAYAHMIGLDPDEVVREFLEVHPEPAEVAAAALAAAAAEEAARRNGPPTRLRTMVDSALGSLGRLRRPAADEPVTAPTRPAASGFQETSPEAVPHRLVVFETADGPLPVDSRDDGTVPGISLERLRAGAEAETIVPRAAESLAPQPAMAQHDDTVVSPTGVEAASLAAVPTPAEPRPAERHDPPAAVPETPRSEPHIAERPEGPDLEAVAGLCTAFARVVDRSEVQRLLQESARILDATGLIVWAWDGAAEALTPALVYGYSEKVLAQLPTVRRDGDNVTAAAFRTGQTCELPGSRHSSGALVVPLLTPEGCAGVLALELQPGLDDTRSIRAMATILAAVLTQLVLRVRLADTRPPIRSPLKVRRETQRIGGA
jgi:hypothetical protein